MKKAERSIKKFALIANSCPYRPKIHFLPPALWINDPNGTIYHDGFYHLFYQTNPFGAHWNHMHWGHAKSKDLVHWDHLPLALSPQKVKGERHCFSGSLVINQGVPTILYTSIKHLLQVRTGGESWSATGDKNLVDWKRVSHNPVMPLTINGGLKIHHWRDPYVWKSEKVWYAVMGGQLQNPKRGAVFLYKSHDLQHWKYLHPLTIGNKTASKPWECPNFFKLGKKWMLIISPFGKVMYTIGTFENLQFQHTKWKIFDHSKNFYATNTLHDEENRLILFGWIRGDKSWKQKKWHGCISLPKILSLDAKEELQISYVAQLKTLREAHHKLKNLLLQDQQIKMNSDIYGQCVEIKVVFRLQDAHKFGISFFEGKNMAHPPSIQYNSQKGQVIVGKEKATCDFKSNMALLAMHIYIDHSVIELIINNKSCLTSRIYPKRENSSQISLFAEHGSVLVESLEIWKLKYI